MATSFVDLSDSGGYYTDDSTIGASPTMSTSMVDLSSLQQINFGNGVTGSYDPTTGTYYDSGGNVLSASDLAAYGSFSVSSAGTTAPTGVASPPSSVSASGSGASLAGLSGLFSGIGAAIANVTRPAATIPSTSGTLVYNPATGTYAPASAITASATMNPLILLLLAGVVLWLIAKEA